MSDYKDETLLTDEEIAAAIAEAKRAKAEKLKAEKAKSPKLSKQKKSEPKKEESSEEVSVDSESASAEEENLSPKMKSAKSFSTAFATAKNKREEELKMKRKAADEEQSFAETEDETTPAQDYDEETEEPVYFDTDSESEEYEEEAAEFEVDGEEEEYDEYSADEEQDGDGIFEVDEEESSGYGERVPVSEYEDEEDDDDDDDDDEEDDDDDDESTFSTKTKVIFGIIIAVLVLAIVTAGFVFLKKGGSGNNDPAVSSITETDVKSIKFAEPSMSLRVGETKPLQIVIEPETAEDKVLSLKSADPSVAKVDGSGNVTGVASGTTTVTATLKSNETITASLVVNVIDEKQNAINLYNQFVTSILDGSTDIDSDADTETEEDTETETDTDSASDSDTDTEESAPQSKTVLTGSIIRDLNSDGDLELALYYENPDEGSSVRIFYLADKNAPEEDEPEPMYDEYGNLIEPETDSEDTESDTATDADAAPAELVITELDIYSEMYSVCYNTLENDATGWDTCYVEVKEEEVAKARVTILSEDYTSPTYVYETSDDSIATVDNQGNIKGLKPGTCFITVTSPLNADAKAMIKVRVKDDTDLLEDYLAQVPKVNSTNDSVIPTETLTGKAITDIDGDGMSELLLRFSYGNNVETINMVKVENDQCVVYKTYNNLSDLYEYYEGDGSYSNSILIHYTTGKVCMEYKAVVSKTDSKTKTSEQKILSVEDGGRLSELVNFTTTTDISTKTVTSEVVIEDNSSNTSSVVDEDSDTWYDDTDSDEYYEDSDESADSDFIDEDGDGIPDDDYGYEGSYAAFTFDDIVSEGGIDLSSKVPAKKLPQRTGVPGDEDGDDDENDDEDNNDDEETPSRVTSTVTSEVTEETTKYFVNGTPVEQSVYEETLSTYSGRYSVWSDWESV